MDHVECEMLSILAKENLRSKRARVAAINQWGQPAVEAYERQQHAYRPTRFGLNFPTNRGSTNWGTDTTPDLLSYQTVQHPVSDLRTYDSSASSSSSDMISAVTPTPHQPPVGGTGTTTMGGNTTIGGTTTVGGGNTSGNSGKSHKYHKPRMV